MPEQDKKPGEEIEQLVDEGIKQGARLFAIVSDQREKGKPFSEEMSVALSSAVVFARLADAILGSPERRMLSSNGYLPTEEIPVLVEPRPQNLLEAPSLDLKPTTFAQLLRQKVEALFPEDQHSLTLPQIKEIIRLQKIDNRVFDIAGLPLDLQSFTRDQAVLLTVTGLTTLRPGALIRQEYTGLNLMQYWKAKREDLDRWSAVIGFSWKKGTTVDHQTALSIKGLASIANRGLEFSGQTLQE